MTYWKSPHFKALQQAWYQRLEAEGFRDAEEMVGDEMELRETAAPRSYRRDDDATRREIRQAYYAILSQKLQDAVFRSDIDRLILTSYCDGKGATTICEELREHGAPRHRHAIRFIVRRYEAAWGLRQYTAAQLGKKVG